MSIDPSKIKPGDTVRCRYLGSPMRIAGIDPVEFTTTAYAPGHPGYSVVCVAGYALDHPGLTILEHTPARHDWADALIVRDKDGDLWVRQGEEWHQLVQIGVTLDDLADYTPITVVLDADGNPPVEWLDADALDKLPEWSVVLPRDRTLPRCTLEGRWFSFADATSGLKSADIAPAQLLWTTED